MEFHLATDLLEIHDFPDLRGGRITWFTHPGLPPIHHYSPAGQVERLDLENTYSRRDLCYVVAAIRYEALYDALSGHGKLSVHAAIAEARAYRGAD